MSKSLEELREWSQENVRLINVLPSNKNKTVDVKLIDIIDKEVDKKYYLTDKQMQDIVFIGANRKNDMTTVAQWNGTNRHMGQRVYDENGVYSTLTTKNHVNDVPKIAIREATVKGYAEAEIGDSVSLQFPNSKTRRGRVGKQIANTLVVSGTPQGIVTNDKGIRIRRLTAKECWRLQGFSDLQYKRAKDDGVSESQLYKQAGNSVTVNIIDAIIKNLK